eukprot:GHUV01029882.1.p1 GENE.GHUV01029882.1~~GHUV01029882.1.p1  ORF type:complete len:164 (+),score=6.55 GHUV01029882.1:542-1033(+)
MPRLYTKGYHVGHNVLGYSGHFRGISQVGCVLGYSGPYVGHNAKRQHLIDLRMPSSPGHLLHINLVVFFLQCRVLDFDVVGHPRANFCFAVTFPYHSYKDGRKGGEVTLIREYAQGPNALMYCLPTGGLDPRRHADVAECAARELSEEVCTLNQLDYSEHILT